MAQSYGVGRVLNFLIHAAVVVFVINLFFYALAAHLKVNAEAAAEKKMIDHNNAIGDLQRLHGGPTQYALHLEGYTPEQIADFMVGWEKRRLAALKAGSQPALPR